MRIFDPPPWSATPHDDTNRIPSPNLAETRQSANLKQASLKQSMISASILPGANSKPMKISVLAPYKQVKTPHGKYLELANPTFEGMTLHMLPPSVFTLFFASCTLSHTASPNNSYLISIVILLPHTFDAGLPITHCTFFSLTNKQYRLSLGASLEGRGARGWIGTQIMSWTPYLK